jgi:glycosyltransferase involved in cell wall biosynthesis
MKICFISGVTSIHTQRWAQYFADKGHEVSVISPTAKRKVNIPKVNVMELALDAFSLKFSFLQKIGFFLNALEIRKLIKKIKPDITHIHSFDYIHPLTVALVNIFLGRFPNLIVSTWGSDVVPNPPRTYFSIKDIFSKWLLLSQAKEITATSQFLARCTSRLAPKKKEIHVVPFGVDCDLFSPRKKIKSVRITIGFVKHLLPKYGPEYIVRAMKTIAEKYHDTKLIMAGIGTQEKELKTLSRSLGVNCNIEFVGKIPHENVPDLLAKVDIFVMPSIYDSESFGVAAVESEAMEIPVVATRVGGVPEVVLDKKTGILVEPRNSEQLANAILRLIENSELRHQMGKNGRKHVMENYNWEDNAELMENIYKKCIQ